MTALIEKILLELSVGAQTGRGLQESLAASDAEFRLSARELWLDGLLQGQLADGCCSAPCGTMCVSAMKLDRVWQLSKKGRLRLKVMQARSAGL
ncbi:MAG: hypothetical protein VKN33_08350 [Candidatus Sericytochromatia bacterium]|nr:hypothetical protein [Candidatus Sericytochromatia bacterium]